jgi:hypothetical protein
LRLRERETLQGMPVRAFVSILLTLMAVSMPVHADERAKEVERFMEEYLRTWNAGDAATITAKIYRFDGPNAFATQAGLQSEFDRLKAGGYSHSKQISIETCWINVTQALVQLRYSRLKVDGTAMPPTERSTLYFVKKTADGLRINNFIPMSPTTKLACSSFVE